MPYSVFNGAREGLQIPRRFRSNAIDWIRAWALLALCKIANALIEAK
jgi:hypothetical protein